MQTKDNYMEKTTITTDEKRPLKKGKTRQWEDKMNRNGITYRQLMTDLSLSEGTLRNAIKHANATAEVEAAIDKYFQKL